MWHKINCFVSFMTSLRWDWNRKSPPSDCSRVTLAQSKMCHWCCSMCTFDVWNDFYHSEVNPCVLCVFADIFRAVLRGGEPVQEPAHLHRVHCRDVSRQETPWDAPAHIRDIRGCLSEHAARYWTLSFTPDSLTNSDSVPYSCIFYQFRWTGMW